MDEGTVKDQGRMGKIPGALCPSKVSGKSEYNEGNSSYAGMNARRLKSRRSKLEFRVNRATRVRKKRDREAEERG